MHINQAAETLGVSVFTIRRLIAARSLRSVSVGKRRLIPQSEVERVLANGCPLPSSEDGAER
jgi:excisionase family DNA binding protein